MQRDASHGYSSQAVQRAHVRVRLVGTLSILSVCCGSPAPDTAAPDTIFVGQFITLDASNPRVEAVGVKNGRIVSVGSRSEVERGTSGATERIEIPGVALPGFADAHVHLSSLGQQLERLDLRGLTKEQVLERVGAAAREAPPGALVSGSGWDQGFFRPPVFPTASDLDAVSGDHPIVLSRIDGHSSWVNSKALALAAISRSTPDPAGGRIERNAAKEPTGILVDRAQDALSRVRPARAGGADRERRIRAALQQYARWGLTSVHDAGTDLETIGIYKDLLTRGELTVRVYVMARGKTATDHYLASGPEVDLGDGRLTIRSFKVVADGALGSRGAALTDPYADAPAERGLDQVSDADLDQLIAAARAKGFQVNVHAIGDRTVRRVLDAFERGGVTREERFRIEHASMIAPGERARFARLGVIASVQPVFVGEYSRWAEERVGPARIRWVLRIRDLITEVDGSLSTLEAVMTGRLPNERTIGGFHESDSPRDCTLRLVCDRSTRNGLVAWCAARAEQCQEPEEGFHQPDTRKVQRRRGGLRQWRQDDLRLRAHRAWGGLEGSGSRGLPGRRERTGRGRCNARGCGEAQYLHRELQAGRSSGLR
jgi:predicted amidohydrolase YtcJ